MKNKLFFPLLLIFAILLESCSNPNQVSKSPTLSANDILTAAVGTAIYRLSQVPTQTSTLTPTSTVYVTPTPTRFIWPTSIPTMPPVQGILKSNANVRSQPGKTSANDIGGLNLGQGVEVLARNEESTWLYIIYSNSPTGTGWIVISAVTMPDDALGKLPIIVFPPESNKTPIWLPPFIYEITGTPLPPSTSAPGWSKYGTLIQSANVRIGPGIGYLSMGYLSVGEKVTFSGKIEKNTWIQIEYPSGPSGHGWILGSLVQAYDGFADLPVYNLLGTQVSTPSSTGVQTPGTLEPTSPSIRTSATQTNGSGVSITKVNVRSGPSSTFAAIDLIMPEDKVEITGRTLNGQWYQIKFDGAASGYGWVFAEYIQVNGDLNNVPFFINDGTPSP